jgi:putative ABC transport system substrate-binding protein
VSTISGDPVGSGLARSLARPGGNVTGVTYYNTELTAKRLELLKELVPGLARVGVLANPKAPPLPFEVDTREAASRLGLALSVQGISEPGEFEPAFARMKAEGVQAVFVLPDLLFAVEAQRIADLALANALPTMTWGSWFAQAGCLAAYSADYEKINYRLAFYVDRIIKGEQPANLPIEQASTYYFTLNLRTANALGIKPPRSIMLIADEVLE